MVLEDLPVLFGTLFEDIKNGIPLLEAFRNALNNVSLSVGKFTIPLLTVGTVVGIVQAVKRHQEELLQTVQANSDAYIDTTQSIADYKNETDSLIKSIESGTLSSEEMYEARLRLSEIEKELKNTYGTNAFSQMFTGDIEGLTLLTANAEQATIAYENLAEAKANQFLNENGAQLEAANIAMLSEQTYEIGGFNWGEMSAEAQNAFRAIADEIDGVEFDIITDPATGAMEAILRVTDTAQNAIPILEEIGVKIREFENLFSADGIDTDSWVIAGKDIDKEISSSISDANDTVDRYGKQHQEYINATITANDEYRNSLSDLQKAEEQYANAAHGIHDSDQDRIDAVRAAYDAAQKATDAYEKIEFPEADVAVKEYMDQTYDSLQRHEKQLDFELKIATSFDEGVLKDDAQAVANGLQRNLAEFADDNGKVWASDILSFGIDPDSFFDDEVLDDKERAFQRLAATFDVFGLSMQEGLSIIREYGLVIGTTSQNLDDATKAYDSFTAGTEAVNNAIKEQAEGNSVSLETYESLIAIDEEYAKALENHGGVIQFNADTLRDLNEAKRRERFETIQTNKAYAEEDRAKKSREIVELRKKIDMLNRSQVARRKELELDLKTLMDERDSIDQTIDRYNLMAAAIAEAGSVRTAWLNAQNMPEPGDSFSDAADAIQHLWQVLNGTGEIRGNVGTAKYKAALDYIIPENSYDKITATEASLRQYLRTLGEILKTDASGNVTDIRMDNIIKKLKQAEFITSQLNENGEMEWVTKSGATLEEFAEILGVSEELARSIVGMLNRNGANIDLGPDIETITDKFKRANEQKEKFLKEDGNVEFDIKTDFSDVEDANECLEEVNKSIEQCDGIVAEYGIKSDEAKAALEIVDYLIEKKRQLEYRTFLGIDVTRFDGEVGKCLSLMEEFTKAKTELDRQLKEQQDYGNTEGLEEAQQKVDEIVDALEGIDPDILSAFDFTPENINADAIEEALKNVDLKELEVGLKLPEGSLTGIQTDLETLKDKDVKVDLKTNGTDSLVEALGYYNSLQNKTVIITIVTKYVGGGGGGDGIIDHGNGVFTDANNPGLIIANGTAHLHGTAKASGDWGTARAGRTLVGELGQEIVVDPHTGRWYTVGDNGAEFVDMPGGAIVFNHIQSRHLLENGYVTGRGKALAGGTAMVSLSGTIPMTGHWQSGGGSGGGDVTVNGDVVFNGGGIPIQPGHTTSAKSYAFEDMYNWHQHLLEMEQETYQEYIDWLSKAYMDAYNNGEYEHDDFYKYEEEVFEGLKELFEDSLSDMEFEISTLLREDGNQQQVINMYNQMIKKVDAQIAAARARGLTDDDDYIQALLEHRYDYEDEIADLQENAAKDAKSAVKDLVDYRIDMLKQELEDEKDALDERLDDLKDFYSKQKEMLDEVHDEEKYLEEQSEKRKEKSDIETELERLKLDDSAWAQKRRLELEEELAEANKELAEFEEDRALDKAKELLDDMYERQEKQIESQIEAIEDKLNDPEALYNQALRDIQNNTVALYEEMVEYNKKHGSGNPEDTKEMWDEAKVSLDRYLATFGEAYKNIILVPSPSGYASGTVNATPGLHEVDEIGAEYIFTSSNGNRYRVFSGGEKVLNARATDFLYNFAVTGGRTLTNILEKIVSATIPRNIDNSPRIADIAMGDIIIQGNADERTVSEIRRAKRDEMQWILKEFNKMNKRS